MPTSDFTVFECFDPTAALASRIPAMGRKMPSYRHRAGFTLIELLVVLAIIGILVALLLPAIQAARESARSAQCKNNLKNVAFALQNYHDANSEFPPAITLRKGTADTILSDLRLYRRNWAILILPYLEEQSLYDSFVFGGVTKLTDAVNSVPRSTELPVMLCPSDVGQRAFFRQPSDGGAWARGNYGYNAFQFWPNPFVWKKFFTDSIIQPLYRVNMGIGGFDDGIYRQVLNFNKLVDGSTHTIMLAELRVGLSDRDRRGVWAMGMCGSNFHCRHAGYSPNSCNGADDDVYGDADILADIGDASLRVECMRPDVGVNESGQSVVRSRHPGGANVAMADGSVLFIEDFIDQGSFDIEGMIDKSQWEDPTLFRTWQRLNSSGDSYALETRL